MSLELAQLRRFLVALAAVSTLLWGLPSSYAQDDGADEASEPSGDGDGEDSLLPPEEEDDPLVVSTDTTGTAEALDERVQREKIFTSPIPPPGDASPEVQAEYAAYREAAERYYREVEEYRSDLQAFVEKEYDAKLAEIDRVYQVKIDELRTEVRIHREDAIARMERFLRKHPDNQRYTPGVLYRLAVLHYERADEEYLAADPATLTADYPDFTTSVGYAEELIRRFPDFPQIDGAYYLVGYCNLEMENQVAARDAFMLLVEKTPESPKAPEALTRIGEFYFNQSQGALQTSEDEGPKWDEAKSYYSRAVEYGPDYAIYDRALYRLAWTEYYKEDYDAMIRRFIDLVEYADQVPEGSSLRQEAIEFMAGVLAEEDWNLQDDVTYDPDFGMTRFNKYLNSDRPFELEVLRVYADTLSEQNRYDHAADAYVALLERSPCNPENPQIHQSYIAALNLSDQRDKAMQVQTDLDALYGPGSEWRTCQEQEGNLEAIAYAESMSRKAMKLSIATYHTRANELYDKEGALLQELEFASERDRPAIEAALADVRAAKQKAFADTASVTSDFVKRYPNDQDVYTYTYILADSHFEAGNYAGAADAFEQVRDMSDGRRRRDAANGAVDARARLLESAVDDGAASPLGLPPYAIEDRYRSGRIATTEVPDYLLRGAAEDDPEAAAELEARGADSKIARKELDDETRTLVGAREKYIEYGLDQRRREDQEPLDPIYRYENAMVYYHHGQLDEARTRFNAIIDDNSQSEFALRSAEFVVDTHRREGDLDKVAEESGRFAEMDLGSGEGGEEQSALFTDMKYGALFDKARQLFENEQYAEAAYEYERIVNENPDFDDIHLALYNAGVAYENLQRYDSAMRLYKRIYDEYNDEPEAADALYRVGFNGERFFDFDAAVDSYLELHDTKRDAFQDHPERTYALRQAAIILKYTEDYDRAARLFERYHDEHGEQEDAADMLYESALMHGRNNDYTKLAKTYERFRDLYGREPDFRVKVLSSYVKQGDWFKERNDFKRARKFYEEAAELHRGSPTVGGPAAASLAAEAQFQLADMEFLDWDKIALEGSLSQFKKRVEEKKAGSTTVSTKFKQVMTYEVPEWSMAATFRIGSMLHEFAETMEDAKCPPRMDDDVCDGLLEGLLEGAVELKAQAKGYYEEVISFGKNNDIVNDWTRRSLNGLNDIAPQEYPLFEGERSALRRSTESAGGLVRPSDLTREQTDDDRDAGKDVDLEEK